jgi:hypothetical protein
MGNSIRVTVAQKQDATMLLSNAEQIDHYLEECHDNLSNSLARMKYSYAPNHVSNISHYTRVFQGFIQHVPTQLRDVGDIQIIQLMPSADGGMPHTRPPHLICYPDLSNHLSPVTFVHELCHIHQRKFPLVWKTIFGALGWTVWNGDLPPQLDTYRRYNPDTIDQPLWIHHNWVPIPVFRDAHKPVLSEVDIWFYHTVQHYHVKTIPDDIRIEGLPPSAYEHPREITAYIISEPGRYKETAAYRVIKEYIDL